MELRLSEISKSYNKNVIKGISLDVRGPSTIAIIGKSGCGKSTLLRLLSGIEFPDSGSVTINNKNVNKENLYSYQSKISMVFQNHNLFPHLTLLENVTLILEKRRKVSSDKAYEIARALFARLQLSGEMHKKPRFVSGGQAQRASIVRALSTNPEIVFMDEPTASLDPILTKEVLNTVFDLKKTGTKFIFVTHEINFVKKFADYIIFMNEGEIIEKGKIGILTNPQTEKLKKFLTE